MWTIDNSDIWAFWHPWSRLPLSAFKMRNDRREGSRQTVTTDGDLRPGDAVLCERVRAYERRLRARKKNARAVVCRRGEDGRQLERTERTNEFEKKRGTMLGRIEEDDAAMPTTVGKLQVIFGPMFSGKSTELQRRLRRHTVASRRVLVVKYAGDNRYDDKVGSSNSAVTHDLATMPALPTKDLSHIDNVVHNYDVVGIDEAQFFDDVVGYCEKWAQLGKVVIVAALDATFQRKPFKSILGLVPLAEEVTKLTAVCTDCAADAAFTARTTKETAVEVIGGASCYKAVCRACYPKYAAEMHDNGATVKASVSTPSAKRVAERMGELTLKTPAPTASSFTFATPATPKLGAHSALPKAKDVDSSTVKSAKKSRGFGGPGRSPLSDFMNSSGFHRSPLSTLR